MAVGSVVGSNVSIDCVTENEIVAGFDAPIVLDALMDAKYSYPVLRLTLILLLIAPTDKVTGGGMTVLVVEERRRDGM